MAKVLKILIALLLVLNIAALVLGSMLYKQREQLKGRTQKLEQATLRFAQAIRQDNFRIEPVKVYATMDQPLNVLRTHGANLYDELQNTKQDLENTRQDLAQTKAELATTKAELAERVEEIASLNQQLDRQAAELAQVRSQVSNLERETAQLKDEVATLTTQSEEMRENLSECEADYQSLQKAYKDLAGEVGTGQQAKKGLAGHILLVNPAWNFVVLDIGSNDGLAPTNEMLVHRSDKLIGRIRVNAVREGLAVAEIMGDWQEIPFRKGDHVISPES
jgi:methyl-accepting chemotaxis protein